MSDDITQEQYDNEVASTALTILGKIEEYPEDYGDDEWKAVHEEVDFHDYVTKRHCFLSVLQYTERGPEEWQTYAEDNEKNHWKVLKAMAYTAFRADVYDEVQSIRETRDDLGEATNLIGDNPIWDEGVTFEYDYEKGLSDPKILTYTLESVEALGGEWFMFDPDGIHFETISPRVMVEDAVVPSKRLKLKLDNLCAKREHERDSENADE